MIKNILLVVMTILTLMFFIFGYLQKIEADNKTELAVILKAQVDKAELDADKASAIAEAARAEADHQRLLAIECENSKKKK